MTQALADMRRDYTRDGLSEAQAPDEPFALFHQWFADAVKTEQPPVEANAMTLATVDQDGRPHCRILLLKGLDTQGFTFFTNYQSAKGEQLAARPFAAMTFFWPTLERQVRIEGRVVKVSPEESDAYFQVRPLGSRLGAWASPQSRVIRDREELQALLKATEQRFSDTQPDCPEHWGGYRLLPERIEVFAMGGTSQADDATETGYYMTRSFTTQAMQQLSKELAGIAAKQGSKAISSLSPGQAGKWLAILIDKVATRFGFTISSKFAAQAVPVMGAFTGATINALFTHFYQDMARGHFIVKRLEEKYGFEPIKDAYMAIKAAPRVN